MADTNAASLVARSLAAALVDDPFYQAISVESGDDACLMNRLTRYFEHSITEGCAIGDVARAGDIGAAIWITSRDASLLHKARDEKLAAISEVLGPAGFSNYQTIVAAMERNLPTAIDPACWYLSIIGVAPDSRSRGIGGGLLSPMLRKADSLTMPCFLETFNPRSIPFYQRLGFAVIETLVEPLTGAPYQVMLRTPRQDRLAA
ncbi:GCN5-related N-acetyltransferase [Solidesulfovibrio fructosivorans JJ]]|uniref:GCN5-related N-acetyltransferase n=1 Tax=Solidesulfovibrio fructosivorans JJ] TaxID=596151 RepID=E1JV92_SOLFR|nr:GNAT family N-acetyltransferase [Solidesulfovibrio fructosivorans]EFL51686.1 GCN5-related N-acetyltransferase [Solidesulfovibrio fructosivorans JJ]]